MYERGDRNDPSIAVDVQAEHETRETQAHRCARWQSAVRLCVSSRPARDRTRPVRIPTCRRLRSSMETVTKRVGLLTPYLQARRIAVARPFLAGRVLDVGCNVGSLAE